MITPELMGYIKGELAKGRTREQIDTTLVNEGGWSEVDISEAFRTLIPMQSFVNQTSAPVLVAVNKKKSIKTIIGNIIFIIFILACVFYWYFYRPQIINFWNSTINSISGFSLPSFSLPSFNFDKIFNFFNKTDQTPQNSLITEPVVDNLVANTVKDCGISPAPDFNNSKTYENNTVLNCIGASAVSCIESKAVLRDVLFPDVFQIVKDGDTCSFKLSYAEDSTFTDVNGKKLAGQYISCPLSIVKMIDESKSIPSFSAPSIENLNKYASQIYFYGTVGLFMENNVDQNKIQNLGCTGDYISSVVASYKKMQSQK